jgi:hypothetical protein
VSRPRPRDEAPPSLHRVRAARVPRLRGYYEALRFPAVLSAPLRCLRKTVTAPCVGVRSDQARRRLGARGVTVRPPKPVVVAAETTGRPKFLENPPVPIPCSLTPAGPDAPSHYGAPIWSPYASQRRLLARGNLGAVWHGLGTPCLRSVMAVGSALPLRRGRSAVVCFAQASRAWSGRRVPIRGSR